jgi:hypothetical protein
VLLGNMCCRSLSETNRFHITMDRIFLGPHCLITESWKKPTYLSADHPVCLLDTLLSHLKNKPIQLWFDSSKNTHSARENSASHPIGLVGHILIICIHTVYLLENLDPVTIIQWRNPNLKTSVLLQIPS